VQRTLSVYDEAANVTECLLVIMGARGAAPLGPFLLASVTIMSLLSISEELRARIFDEVLVKPHQPVQDGHRTQNPEPLSLLLVNRQIYKEASKIYYENNPFVYSVSENQAFKFPENIGPDRRHKIQDLTMLMSSPKNTSKKNRKNHWPFTDYHCELIRDCTNLETLRLHYTDSQPFQSLQSPRNLLDLHGLKNVSITLLRDMANEAEQNQDDAVPVLPDDPPCVEMQNPLADQLRAAWLLSQT